MNRICSLLIFVSLVTVISACQKKDNTTPDPSKVAFSITSPISGNVYHTGNSVAISTSVSYVTELHGYAVKITDSATGDVYYEDDHDLHNDHFTYEGTWDDTISRSATLQLQIMAFIDDNGTAATKTISFKTLP